MSADERLFKCSNTCYFVIITFHLLSVAAQVRKNEIAEIDGKLCCLHLGYSLLLRFLFFFSSEKETKC